ncbi:MAG: DUF1257 domain-containing protein [Chloroflexota bacterium]
MSHISRIKTKMVEEEFLTQALTDLGYTWQVVEHRAGQRVKTRFKSGLISREVNFVKAGDTYSMSADWWGIPTAERQKFQEQLLQRYAYHAACSKFQAQGFDLVSEEARESGQIRLVLRRVA